MGYIEEVKEGARKNWREPGRIFKVIFQGLFFGKKLLDMFWGNCRDVNTYSEQKRFMGQDF